MVDITNLFGWKAADTSLYIFIDIEDAQVFRMAHVPARVAKLQDGKGYDARPVFVVDNSSSQ